MDESQTSGLDNADRDAAAKEAVIRRYWGFCLKWTACATKIAEFERQIAEIEAEQQKIAEQINDCVAAGRIFGFDVVLESQRQMDEQTRQQYSLGVIEAPPVRVPSIPHSMPKPPKIKDLVLGYVEKAHPFPVKTIDIKQSLAERGLAIHEKTVGMTLTRWLRQNRVRRDGHDWFFVPQPNDDSARAGQFDTASEEGSSAVH